jgi:septum formation topological specificity factor MinE
MGLFDRFKGRRQSEDALAGARAEAPTTAGAPAPLKTDSGETIGVPVNSMGLAPGETPAALAGQVPGLENLGAIGAMIQQAVASGNVQVIQAESQQMQQQALAMRQSMLDVLAKHGVDATPGAGQSFPMGNMELQKDIMAVLQKHGVSTGFDPAAMGFGTPPASPAAGTPPMQVEPGTPGEPEAS